MSDNLVTVATFWDGIEAHMARNRLDAAGIRSILEGEMTVGMAWHLANAVGAPRYPRLARQRPSYIVQQLTNFKTGARTNDRAHVMRSIAANLSEEDMRAVAEYLAGR